MAKDNEIKAAIKKGNQTIADFQQHSSGRLNLWTSIVTLNRNYIITVEAQKRVGTGITTAIICHLSFNQYTADDYLAVLMGLQRHWNIPVLCHGFSRKQLANLRHQYGSRIIRDDIVRRYR
ncbi:MAG: transposase [Limosilactobacillus sp.]